MFTGHQRKWYEQRGCTNPKVKKDTALAVGGRGARKIVVTELYQSKEVVFSETSWIPPETPADPCSVLLSTKCVLYAGRLCTKVPSYELAMFTNMTPQDRHYHKKGTEIYSVVEGEMVVEVDGTEFQVTEGGTLIVEPGAVHLVKSVPDTHFLCQVVTVNCGGVTDKYIV